MSLSSQQSSIGDFRSVTPHREPAVLRSQQTAALGPGAALLGPPAMTRVGVYEFDSPSLHTGAHQAQQPQRSSSQRQPQRSSKPKAAQHRDHQLPSMASRRVGGFADRELKAQLAQAVYNFSETPGERPLHGFTPDAQDGPAVTPIPVATSFRPPPGGGARRQPQSQPQPQQTPDSLMPPPATPLTQSTAQAPGPSDPSASASQAASGTPCAAASPSTAAPTAASAASGMSVCGLLWEPMEEEASTKRAVPMRVPKKKNDLPDEKKFEISALLDEDEDPFGW